MADKKQRCENCSELWTSAHLCYCEDCDEVCCVECALEDHKKQHAVVYLADLGRSVNDGDCDICGNDSCQHYRKDHEAGDEGRCVMCEARIGPATAGDIAKDLRCPQFVDQTEWTDQQKFWKSFDSVAALSSRGGGWAAAGQSKKTVMVEGQVLVTADTFTLQLVCQSRWGWRPEKTVALIKDLEDSGEAKVIKRGFFNRDTSKSQQAVARVPREKPQNPNQ